MHALRSMTKGEPISTGPSAVPTDLCARLRPQRNAALSATEPDLSKLRDSQYRILAH